MIQQAVIIILFLGALGYIGTRIFRTFGKKADSGCGKGCGCDTNNATA
jgi:hypothetical protein